MSNFQNQVLVPPPPPPRTRSRAVIISDNLPWLSELTRSVGHKLKVTINLNESFCEDIEGCECGVCLEDTTRAEVRRFGCGHGTCNSCFKRIYATNPICPLCRRIITKVMSAPL
jgi:hypothetical protein